MTKRFFAGIVLGVAVIFPGAQSQARPAAGTFTVAQQGGASVGSAKAHGLTDHKPNTSFAPQEYGAKCDEVTDDQAALARFFAAVSDAAFKFGQATAVVKGRCATSGSLYVKAAPGMKIAGADSSSGFVCTDQGRTKTANLRCLEISGGGATGPSRTITEDVPRNATRIKVSDGSNFSPGNYISIAYSRKTGGNSINQGGLNRVIAVSGNILTLAYPVPFEMSHLGKTAVQSHVTTSNVSITNLSFDGTRSTGLTGVYAHDLVQASLSGLRTKRFTGDIGATGILLHFCDKCLLRNLRDDASGYRNTGGGHGMSLSFLHDSDATNLVEVQSGGFGIEPINVTDSRFTNIRVDGSWGRALKVYGSTNNVFRNIYARHGDSRSQWISFGLTDGSSYNKVYGLTAEEGLTCVWLNGVGNNFNSFVGVKTRDCHGLPARGGGSIWVAGIDTGNTFADVDAATAAQVSVQGPQTIINGVCASPDHCRASGKRRAH